MAEKSVQELISPAPAPAASPAVTAVPAPIASLVDAAVHGAPDASPPPAPPPAAAAAAGAPAPAPAVSATDPAPPAAPPAAHPDAPPGTDKLHGWQKYEGALPAVSGSTCMFIVRFCFSLEPSFEAGGDPLQGSQFVTYSSLPQQGSLQEGDWTFYSATGQFPGGQCLIIRPDGMFLRLARGIVLHIREERMGLIHGFAYSDLKRNKKGLGRLRILYLERQVWLFLTWQVQQSCATGRWHGHLEGCVRI